MKGLVSVHFFYIKRPIDVEPHMHRVANLDRTYFSTSCNRWTKITTAVHGEYESGYEAFKFIEKPDTSGSKEHSSITRTLILSPNDKYLSSELLNNITGKLVPSK